MEGPQKSMSRRPTSYPRLASYKAIYDETVLFPTPPFPERTNTLCLTDFKRSLIAFNAGSGSFAFPEAQSY